MVKISCDWKVTICVYIYMILCINRSEVIILETLGTLDGLNSNLITGFMREGVFKGMG